MDRPSRRTAWDYWKWITGFLFFACLIFVLYQLMYDRAEKRISMSKSEFILIYQNGYLKGVKNAFLHQEASAINKAWQKDSTEIIQFLFK
jgi:hypothetical protein